MIEMGQTRLRDRTNISFIKGRFQDRYEDLIDQAGVVTIAANTYALLLDREERIRTLKNAHCYLRKNGRLFVHVRTDSPSREYERRSLIPLDGNQSLAFHIRWSEDFNTNIRTFDFTMEVGNRRETYSYPTAIIPFSSLMSEFEEAGFSVSQSYGDFDLRPIHPDSVHWFFELRKS